MVHTLGTLLEDTGYKDAVRKGDVAGVLGGFVSGLTGGRVGGGNPLERKSSSAGGTYERLNRDAGESDCFCVAVHSILTPARLPALRVCEAFTSSSTSPDPTTARTDADADAPSSSPNKRLFVYISAEDIFRPFVPARYIETKRQAERGIHELLRGRQEFRAAFIRPSMFSVS